MVIRAWVACFVMASGTAVLAQGTQLQAPPARSANAQPRISTIICGTRVLRADPSIDPKFAKAAPHGTFTLRTLRPPVCHDAFSTPSAELKQRLPQFLGPKR
jgi:hypothetical protein